MKSDATTKNLIIKTLVVLVIFTLFVTAVFMVFFPKQAANAADNFGMDQLANSFQKTSYARTGDINTLADILSYEIYSDNAEEIAEYGMEMLYHKDYEAYVEFLGASSLTSMEYNVYVETYLLSALYEIGSEEEIIAILSNGVNEGYETFGIGIVLCADVNAAQDDTFADALLEIYESNFNGASDMKQYNITIEAMLLANGISSDYDVWAARLQELDEKFA